MSRPLKRASTLDLVEGTKGGSTGNEVDPDELTPDMVEEATTLAKKNPIVRSQQYKEATKIMKEKSTTAKSTEVSKEEDPDFDPEGNMEEDELEAEEKSDEDDEEEEEEDDEEYYDDEEEEDDDEEEQQEQDEDENEKMEDDDDDDEVQIIKFEKQMPRGQKPSFVKNLTSALNAVAPRKPNVKPLVVGLKDRKRNPMPIPKNVTYGVEKSTEPKKRMMKKKLATPAHEQSSVRVVKANPLVVQKAQKRKLGSGVTTAAVKPCALASKKKKTSTENEEVIFDFAPNDDGGHLKRMGKGDCHLGEDIHFGWHDFQGKDYAWLRAYLPDKNGHMVVNKGRGINFSVKLLPTLLKSVELAHKRYMETQKP